MIVAQSDYIDNVVFTTRVSTRRSLVVPSKEFGPQRLNVFKASQFSVEYFSPCVTDQACTNRIGTCIKTENTLRTHTFDSSRGMADMASSTRKEFIRQETDSRRVKWRERGSRLADRKRARLSDQAYRHCILLALAAKHRLNQVYTRIQIRHYYTRRSEPSIMQVRCWPHTRDDIAIDCRPWNPSPQL